MTFLTKNWNLDKDYGLLLLRIVVGIVLLYGHGYEKLSLIYSGQKIEFLDPIGIGAVPSFYMAAFAEGLCATLLILGLFSRYAALILCLNFTVILYTHIAIFQDSFGALELRYLYLAIFLTLLLTGSGKYSLDQLINRRK